MSSSALAPMLMKVSMEATDRAEYKDCIGRIDSALQLMKCEVSLECEVSWPGEVA